MTVVVEEIEADLRAYFATYPNAPVQTLREIVISERCLPQVAAALRRSLEQRSAGVYEEKLRQRVRLRQLVLGVLENERLDALIYPVSRIETPSIESAVPYNVALSPCAGLPAITVPAGFTAAGMPVGIELLGRPWSEPRLLAMAYAYEQATKHRKPPATTPALR